MNDAAPTRSRLLAILAADAAGYSRLMSVDDRGTLAALDDARAVFRQHVTAHSGRVIDMAGDSVLAVFETATSAVNAALAIQRQLTEALAGVPDERRMRFRIGVHVGDVIEKTDTTVYGDGVNIAARLQSIAEPGGVTVSQAVQGIVAQRVDAQFDDIGEQVVKNITQPVRAFALRECASAAVRPRAVAQAVAAPPVGPRRRWPWLAGVAAGVLAVVIGAAVVWSTSRPAGTKAPAATTAEAHPLSIVVLPFTNLTGDLGQDYVADGLTAALTADLSRIEGAFVIDSATAHSYKGKPQTAQQVGQALGVRFVLQGSVQRSGNQIRINALLADATTNKQLWADSFEGETSNLFALQDQVTGRIANTMGQQIVVVAARESEKRKDTPQVADLLLRAAALGDKPHSLDKWQQIEQLYRQALALDPGNVYAMASLAGALAFQTSHVRDAAQRETIWAEALELAAKVTAIDPKIPEPHRVIAFHGLTTGNLERARRAAETYLSLNPRDPAPYNVLGNVYFREGNAVKAVALHTQAVGLAPKNSSVVFPSNLARDYFMLGDYKAAIDWYLKALQAEPQSLFTHIGLAMAYAMAGDDAQARAETQEVRRLRPGYKVDVEKLRAESASATPAYKTYLEDKAIPAFRKAGLTE